MPRGLLTGSAHRYIKDTAKYALYPALQVGARGLGRLAYFGLNKATNGAVAIPDEKLDKYLDAFLDNFAGMGVSLGYMGLTAYWTLREGKEIDDNFRYVVAAEFGIEPGDVTFSHYKQSNNAILKREFGEFVRLNRDRFLADATGLAVSAGGLFYHGAQYRQEGKELEWDKAYKSLSTDISESLTDYVEEKGRNTDARRASVDRVRQLQEERETFRPKPSESAVLRGLKVFAPMLTYQTLYGAQSLNWFLETFTVDRSAHFDTIYLADAWDPSRDGTFVEIAPRNLWSIYQRTRRDAGVPMVDTAEERQIYEPIMERLANSFNNTDRYFDRMARDGQIYDDNGNVRIGQSGIGIPEVMYLFGDRFLALAAKYKNAIDTQPERRGEFNRLLQQEMLNEITHVEEVGLVGIMREKRQQREEGREQTMLEKLNEKKTRIDKFLDRFFDRGSEWAAENRFTRSELWARSVEEKRELGRTPDVYQSAPSVISR